MSILAYVISILCVYLSLNLFCPAVSVLLFYPANLRVSDQPALKWTTAATNASLLREDHGDSRDIPDYVLEYAPYCYLYSGEEYWPGLLSEHLDHTVPHINYDSVPREFQQPNLDDLDQLNAFGNIFLMSNDDPENYPDWLGGLSNVPDSRLHRSSAPAILIMVSKGQYIDAFWFFFYSFNLGNQVLGHRFGNHVGDWEHTVIRFENRRPIEVYYSEHAWGAAYRWEHAERHPNNRKRLLTYSAYGTHAMYRTAGNQPYVLPFGLLQDITDKGRLWDPTLNMFSYTYDPREDTLRASNFTPDVPEAWFHFNGRWGDKAYPTDDPRQYEFLGALHYESGPTGPKFKNLGRSAICENSEIDCSIRNPIDDQVPRNIQPAEWEHWKRSFDR
ncbi:hypothetical protein BT63DRAFT_375539 [Microthyrium microscopicum]|uniref:Vacuolar protein sorting-associated protein 62 n=1 Tax=Microthyrium microscopicum TaxID=703497 RepID=A0A6A6U8I8_9PEZI|nr:hypothetical protein BT63DRAFT_375539 [Microthyrium microscopicum]